jgi:hypothetical protein
LGNGSGGAEAAATDPTTPAVLSKPRAYYLPKKRGFCQLKRRAVKSTRPRGHCPKGVRWNADLRAFEPDPLHVPLPPKPPRVDTSAMGRRPKGKAPRGKRWNVELQGWEDDPDYAPPNKRKGSGFVGVYPYNPTEIINKSKFGGDKWGCKFKVPSKKHSDKHGPYDTEEDAARAYDALAGPLGRPVNFPAAGSSQAHAVKGAKSSQYRGVSWHSAAKLWYPSIRVNGKNPPLGYFKDEAAAARKYDEVARPLGRLVNFPLPPAPDEGCFAVAAPPFGNQAAALSI